jgi:hypothetical protein
VRHHSRQCAFPVAVGKCMKEFQVLAHGRHHLNRPQESAS